MIYRNLSNDDYCINVKNDKQSTITSETWLGIETIEYKMTLVNGILIPINIKETLEYGTKRNQS